MKTLTTLILALILAAAMTCPAWAQTPDTVTHYSGWSPALIDSVYRHKAMKKYLLRPYKPSNTMCRLWLSILFLKYLWNDRNNLYLEYRISKVEAQDEARVFWLNIGRLITNISLYQVYTLSIKNKA